MIHLSLAIDEGDAVLLKFVTVHELMEYVKELKSFDSIWVATNGYKISTGFKRSSHLILTKDN